MATLESAEHDYKLSVIKALTLFLEECKPVDAAYLRRLKEARKAYEVAARVPVSDSSALP
jgi:hypothetical protein